MAEGTLRSSFLHIRVSWAILMQYFIHHVFVADEVIRCTTQREDWDLLFNYHTYAWTHSPMSLLMPMPTINAVCVCQHPNAIWFPERCILNRLWLDGGLFLLLCMMQGSWRVKSLICASQMQSELLGEDHCSLVHWHEYTQIQMKHKCINII